MAGDSTDSLFTPEEVVEAERRAREWLDRVKTTHVCRSFMASFGSGSRACVITSGTNDEFRDWALKVACVQELLASGFPPDQLTIYESREHGEPWLCATRRTMTGPQAALVEGRATRHEYLRRLQGDHSAVLICALSLSWFDLIVNHLAEQQRTACGRADWRALWTEFLAPNVLYWIISIEDLDVRWGLLREDNRMTFFSQDGRCLAQLHPRKGDALKRLRDFWG